MMREKALKVVLVVVGLFFVAMAYLMTQMILQRGMEPDAEPMMLSLYVVLGIFLLLAARNPAGHRSLIAFAGWSSVFHASVMMVQTLRTTNGHAHLLGDAALFGIIGIILTALGPGKAGAEHSLAGT